MTTTCATCLAQSHPTPHPAHARRRRRIAKKSAAFAAVPLLIGGPLTSVSTVPNLALASTTQPAAQQQSQGAVAPFGDAQSFGSPSPSASNPLVGIDSTPDGKGYWLAGSGGGVFSYGDAGFFGSLGSQHLNSPVVAIAATPTGHGYWLVSSDGGVFSFGDAGYHGSAASLHLAHPVVSLATTPSGDGYWLATTDGGVFSYGDARFQGSAANDTLSRPITAIAATPSGDGYWLLDADGGVFSFGGAPFRGSLSPEPSSTAAVAIASTPTGGGYWLATAPTPSDPPPSGQSVQAASSGSGTSSGSSANSGPSGTAMGTFQVTCYDTQGRTATGAQTSTETVAVDPNVIPLGSTIWIDGVGRRVAQDTGGDIVGHRLDIWEPSYSACQAWGVQNRSVWMESSG